MKNNIEKEVEKIIKLSFPKAALKDWNSLFVDGDLNNEYLRLIEYLVIKEKDKMLFNATNYNYLRKKVYFDTDYKFNDTLNKLKQATIDLLNVLNDN